eukprot:m.73303 g.73303  ORF g.73303 m.73303 type:complete len:110 (+) comp14322_c0_seq2:141-470(+)
MLTYPQLMEDNSEVRPLQSGQATMAADDFRALSSRQTWQARCWHGNTRTLQGGAMMQYTQAAGLVRLVLGVAEGFRGAVAAGAGDAGSKAVGEGSRARSPEATMARSQR